MAEPRIPPELLRSVRADLRPVRPLASPARRLLAMLPLALALLFLPPLYWGWRGNLGQLAGVFAWPLSALESGAGLALLWLAFRESVPGNRSAATWMRLAMALSAALFVAVTCTTDLELPTVPPDGAWLRYARECIGMALLFALPAVALVGWLVARALPSRPGLVGAAYGLGIGLMTDAGVRLFCWVSEPAHVLVAHGGAIALSAFGGALAAVLVENGRRAARRRDGASG